MGCNKAPTGSGPRSMASMDFGDAFGQLLDDEFWMEAAFLFAGFLAPAVVGVVTDEFVPELPNEAFGVGGIVAGELIDERQVSLGAATYTLDQLALRVGAKQAVMNLGGDN